MSEDSNQNQDFNATVSGDETDEAGKRPLTPAAKRALAEAEARRTRQTETMAAETSQKELGGRKGPDPVRFGDWEKGGLASDF